MLFDSIRDNWTLAQFSDPIVINNFLSEMEQKQQKKKKRQRNWESVSFGEILPVHNEPKYDKSIVAQRVWFSNST